MIHAERNIPIRNRTADPPTAILEQISRRALTQMGHGLVEIQLGKGHSEFTERTTTVVNGVYDLSIVEW